MHRAIVFISILFILGSCYKNTRPPAFDMSMVFPADTMISVLTDLHLAEGMINTQLKKDQPLGQISGEYFHTIMEKHQMTLPEFEESMRYYSYYTEELDKIYEQVIINLSTIEGVVLKK